jgi:nicotinamide phosphoribosyltransferase
MNYNPMLLIDGYKLDHRRQYPDHTRRVYSNWTPRSSRIADQKEVVFFGLQYFLQKYLVDDMKQNFFNRPVDDVCREYQQLCDSYLGPNDIGTDHIRALHNLGYIPLEFKALPEGTLCPLGVPMLTVENTHDDFAWLVNYFETIMSSILWLPCTSATNAYRLRKLLNQHADTTSGSHDFVQWQGHDFSMRGMSGLEASVMSGAGHLLSFTGSDSIPSIEFIKNYYGAPEGTLIAGSVPATEHSVMCAGGELSERETFERLLQLYPKGIVSVVSDTWNLWDVITKILPEIKDRILARDGKLVIRPDSGNPADIICGDPTASNEAARKGVIELLWEVFGGTVNAKGFKELDPHIGCIYGDAITYERANEICQRLAAKGFASTNMVYGIGSFTYQYVTRDVYGFAMKATWANINGEGRPLFKKPVTDSGTKFSARGRLNVVRDTNGQLTVEQDVNDHDKSLLKTVWRDGIFTRWQQFTDVRNVLWNKVPNEIDK